MVFFCLAGKTLRREVQMAFEAADRSVEDGRRQVGRIVGRDTSNLSDQEVRTAALETLAENLSDGVVAPLFWFILLGVPGMMTYKMVNTLDSMIGYKTERYKEFGCWAARIDDYANYLPARLTAVLIVVAEKLMRWKQTQFKWLMMFVGHYGPQHSSPNSGWPEAALAGVLDCRFGGGHNYFGVYFPKPFIGDNPRRLTTADMWRSLQIASVVETLMVGVLIILLYV
jgi:adenosylcobinamide-phosphate synthase